MTVSVVMCTYNGEKFIKPQLDSIFAQTMKPDEVIIVDDKSTDETVNIVESFIIEHQLNSSWKLRINEERKGYPQNFYYAMSLARGEVVFLSDQDDLWVENKISKMLSVIESNSNVNVLCCGFKLVDFAGKRIRNGIIPHVSHGVRFLKKIDLKSLLRYNAYPGMALCYRREWVSKVIKEDTLFSIEKIPHDLLICILAAQTGSFFHMKGYLCFHRRHTSNFGREENNIIKQSEYTRKLKEISIYIMYLDELLYKEMMSDLVSRTTITFWKRVLEDRYEALKSQKIRCIFRNCIRYCNSIRIFSFFSDVLACICAKKSFLA